MARADHFRRDTRSLHDWLAVQKKEIGVQRPTCRREKVGRAHSPSCNPVDVPSNKGSWQSVQQGNSGFAGWWTEGRESRGAVHACRRHEFVGRSSRLGEERKQDVTEEASKNQQSEKLYEHKAGLQENVWKRSRHEALYLLTQEKGVLAPPTTVRSCFRLLIGRTSTLTKRTDEETQQQEDIQQVLEGRSKGWAEVLGARWYQGTASTSRVRCCKLSMRDELELKCLNQLFFAGELIRQFSA